jgi:hypothetical protein
VFEKKSRMEKIRIDGDNNVHMNYERVTVWLTWGMKKMFDIIVMIMVVLFRWLSTVFQASITRLNQRFGGSIMSSTSPTTSPDKQRKKPTYRNREGTEYQKVSEVFKHTESKISGLYMLIVGSVPDVMEAFKVELSGKNNFFFCKVGKSNDLARRFSEHERYYGRMPGADLRLYQFETTKVKNLTDAENTMLKRMDSVGDRVDNDRYREVFVIRKDRLKEAGRVLVDVCEQFS